MQIVRAGILTLCTACVLLTACVSPNTYYQPPTQGPIASLRIETTAPHRDIRVVSYTGIENAESDGHLITILNSTQPATETSKSITLDIAAGQAFRFSTTISNTISYAGNVVTSTLCKTHSRFMPQPGAHYLARHHSLAGNDCIMEVFRIGENDSRLPETSLEDLAWCIDPKVDDPAYSEKYPDKLCR